MTRAAPAASARSPIRAASPATAVRRQLAGAALQLRGQLGVALDRDHLVAGAREGDGRRGPEPAPSSTTLPPASAASSSQSGRSAA